MKKRILLFVALACNNLVFAQNNDTLKGKDFTPAIIRALRAGTNAPFTKSTLTQEEIARQNTGVDLPIILNNLPNAVSNSDAGTGVGYTGIRLRGSDITRINVTLNGVPVNDAESQTTYFVDLPDVASSANSIVVTRGVGSSTNGAGAFGGSININTFDLPKDAHVNYQSNVGSFNTFRNTLKIGTGLLNNKFNATVRLSKINSDGYIQRSASALLALQLTAAYVINNSTSIGFYFSSGKEKTGQAWNGVPQDSLATNRTYNELGMKANGSFYNNQTDNYTQNYYQLFLNKNISTRWKLNIGTFATTGNGFYEEYKTAQNYSDYHLPNVTIGTDTFTKTDLIRQLWLDNVLIGAMATSIATYGNSTITLGAHYNNYSGKHYGIVTWANQGISDYYKWYNLKANKSDANVFAKWEWKFSEKLNIFSDVQLRNANYQLNGFRENPTLKIDTNYVFINPKFGGSYLLNNNNKYKQMLYASIAYANKEPNRDDFENGVTTPKSEHLRDIELGYNFSNKKIMASANVFFMHYKNQLVLVGNINDVGAYTRENIANSYRKGIELSVDKCIINKQLNVGGNLSLSANKILNYTDKIDDYDNGSTKDSMYKKTNISFSPSVIASAFATYQPLKNTYFTLQYKYVGKQYLDNTQSESKKINEYGTFDFLASHQFLLQKKTSFTIKFGIQNIFNKMYQTNGYTYSYISGGMQTYNYYFPHAGTQYNLGFGVDF